MWNYFGQKSTKVLLAFLLLAGAGGAIVAINNNGETETNINDTSESSGEEVGDDTVKGEGVKVENTYTDPRGVSESTGAQSDWSDEGNYSTSASSGGGSYSTGSNSGTNTSNTMSGTLSGTVGGTVSEATSSSEPVTSISAKNMVVPTSSNTAVATITKEVNKVMEMISENAVIDSFEKDVVGEPEQNEEKVATEEPKQDEEKVATEEPKQDETPSSDISTEPETPVVSDVDTDVNNNGAKDDVIKNDEAENDGTNDNEVNNDEAKDNEINDEEETNDILENSNINVESPNPDATTDNMISEEEEAVIRAEEEEIKENVTARELEQVSHPELYAGWENVVAYNTYPWQTDCPESQDQYLTTINGIKVGGYVCECVSYVGWKAFESYGLYLGWGNAYSWDDRARALGYAVNHTPEANSIGQLDSGVYGHVFWVERVNNDGSIDVTEYNNAYATQIRTGYFYYGDFGTRTIPATEVSQYNYIHLR